MIERPPAPTAVRRSSRSRSTFRCCTAGSTTLRLERIGLRDRYIRHSDNTPGGRVERDLSYASHAAAVQQLNAAEDRLCFGRLDRDDGESMHIGRMGIFDDTGDQRQLLMDWRAPSSRPFYVATAANPLGAAPPPLHPDPPPAGRGRQRRIPGPHRPRDGCGGRQAAPSGRPARPRCWPPCRRRAPAGWPTSSPPSRPSRTRIIRADQAGIIVVQGGPGTGKTAVALHRAAYLLYNHRAQLEQRGVLIIGPEPDVPRLHQPGAALPRRERRRAVHRRRPVPRGVRAGDRGAGRSPGSRAGRR